MNTDSIIGYFNPLGHPVGIMNSGGMIYVDPGQPVVGNDGLLTGYKGELDQLATAGKLRRIQAGDKQWADHDKRAVQKRNAVKHVKSDGIPRLRPLQLDPRTVNVEIPAGATWSADGIHFGGQTFKTPLALSVHLNNEAKKVERA